MFTSVFFAQASTWCRGLDSTQLSDAESRRASAAVSLCFYGAEWHYFFLRAERVSDFTSRPVSSTHPNPRGHSRGVLCSALDSTSPREHDTGVDKLNAPRCESYSASCNNCSISSLLAKCFLKQRWRLKVSTESPETNPQMFPNLSPNATFIHTLSQRFAPATVTTVYSVVIVGVWSWSILFVEPDVWRIQERESPRKLPQRNVPDLIYSCTLRKPASRHSRVGQFVLLSLCLHREGHKLRGDRGRRGGWYRWTDREDNMKREERHNQTNW